VAVGTAVSVLCAPTSIPTARLIRTFCVGCDPGGPRLASSPRGLMLHHRSLPSERKVRQPKYRSQRRQGLRVRRRLWPPLDRAVAISSKGRGGEGTASSVVGTRECQRTAVRAGRSLPDGTEQWIPIGEPGPLPS
jgi:hypothetical protein